MSATRLLATSLFLSLLLCSLVMAEDEKVSFCGKKLSNYYGKLPCDDADVAAAKASAIDTSAGLLKCCLSTGCSKYYLLAHKCT